MKRFYWVGYSHEERRTTTQKVAGVINSHGAVVDIHFFSDLSTSFTIELPANQVDALYQALGELIELEDVEPTNKTASYECTVLLNLSFGAGTGNLKQTIPQVPG